MAGPLDDNREAEDEFGSADPPSVRSSTGDTSGNQLAYIILTSNQNHND